MYTKYARIKKTFTPLTRAKKLSIYALIHVKHWAMQPKLFYLGRVIARFPYLSREAGIVNNHTPRVFYYI